MSTRRQILGLAGAGLGIYGASKIVIPWWRKRKRRQRFARQLMRALQEAGPVRTVPISELRLVI